MTLIDSSAWIELFRASGSPAHRRLKALIASGEELLTTGPVSMELLAGAASASDRRRIRAALAACRRLPVSGERDWEDAAFVYVACRGGGVTPRRLLDCLIAAIAIRDGVPLLAQDRDFELIADHTPLQLAPAPADG